MKSGRRACVAAYRACLRAFPRTHRARYGAEMVDAFGRALRARARGSAPLGFTVTACMDAVRAGMSERRRLAGGRRRNPLGGIGQDFAHAVRALSGSWTFTFVCLFSLAIGLGVTMALALLLRVTVEPPFELDRTGLVELMVRVPGDVSQEWAYPDFQDVAAALPDVDLVGWSGAQGTLRTSPDEPGRRVRMAYVSPGYHRLLGVPMALGRPYARGMTARRDRCLRSSATTSGRASSARTPTSSDAWSRSTGRRM